MPILLLFGPLDDFSEVTALGKGGAFTHAHPKAQPFPLCRLFVVFFAVRTFPSKDGLVLFGVRLRVLGSDFARRGACQARLWVALE